MELANHGLYCGTRSLHWLEPISGPISYGQGGKVQGTTFFRRKYTGLLLIQPNNIKGLLRTNRVILN